MPLLDQILLSLVQKLIADGSLELAEGATDVSLARELQAALAEARPFSSVGPALAQAFVSSEQVEEIYCSDDDLGEALKAITP